MAEGRMLNKHIGWDKAVHNLSSYQSKLAFTWTLPHLDRDGRAPGDPEALRSIVFPRDNNITTAQMESYIHEWAAAGLVVWYEAKGDRWLSFPNFRKNQRNLRYEKEAVSRIPAPEEGTDLLRTKDGPAPPLEADLLHQKRREEKGREDHTMESGGPTPPQVRPSSPPSAVAKNRPVYHLIEQAFLNQHTEFDFKREGPHIKKLEEKALARDGPEKFAKTIIVMFWQLIHSEDPFWRKQPFLPSVLNSGGIWPRVLKELENLQAEQLDEKALEIIKGINF